MRRIVIYRLASVAALALIPLACNDLGAGLANKIADESTTGISITPNAASLAVGDVLQLEVTVRDPFKEIPEDVPFIWETDDPSVADVDSEGRVEASEPGEATITLRYWQYEVYVLIEVDPPYPDDREGER